jgi:choline dehydrogenase-like flavoprotein
MWFYRYDAISVIAGGSSANVEYWRNSAVLGDWEKEKPPQTAISTPGIIHEASTLYMGDSDKWEEVKPNSGSYPAVDSSYKPYGCKNVYVTGSALFPTAGSWNPTLTICGYTQDLAARIVKNRTRISKL